MTSVEQLLHLMAALRDPENGCPWDRQQDFASIAPCTIEEAYEVADAIDRNAMSELCDELGDLLFQVVFHAQMAKEKGLFDFHDVVVAISHKIERRHPHVFADEVIESAGEQSLAWEQHKRREREASGNDSSLLDGISLAVPALARAQKLQQRAASAGFDWSEPRPVMDKLHEELQELSSEMAAAGQAGEAGNFSGNSGIREELGDLLFTCVNLARHLQVDAEAALRAANQKFERRFHHMEARLAESGSSLEQTPAEQLEVLWLQAKRQGG